MADDDEEEMRALRASRQFQQYRSRVGDRAALRREREEQAAAAAARPPADLEDEEFGPPRPPALAATQPPRNGEHGAAGAQGGAGEEEDEEDEEDEEGAEGEDMQLRGLLPSSFGARASARRGPSAADLSRFARKEQLRPPSPRGLKRPREAGAKGGGGGGGDDSDSDSGSEFGPPRPPAASEARGEGGKGGGKEEEDEEEEEEDGAVWEGQQEEAEAEGAGAEAAETREAESGALRELRLPVTHEAVLEGHARAVSALALDAAGARLLTGAYDYKVKLWDFGGMNERLQSFREIEPWEGQHVCHLAFSASGDQFLAVTSHSQLKVFTREGVAMCETARGDGYLMDMRNTKGHVTDCTGGHWHPTDRGRFISSSRDGTVRLWDLAAPERNLFVAKLAKLRASQQRVAVTACAISSNGKLVAGAGSDGSLQLWRAGLAQGRPERVIEDAHVPGTATSCVRFLRGDQTLLSRGGDGTLKVWDLRRSAAPVAVVDALPSAYEQTDVALSPDESVLLTGLSTRDGKGQSALAVLDARSWTRVGSLAVGERGVVRVLWHAGINQIFVGCADARTRVLYSPELSRRGALMAVGRRARQRDPGEMIEHQHVIAPYELPAYNVKGARRGPQLSAKRLRADADAQGKGRVGAAAAPPGQEKHVRSGKSYLAFMKNRVAEPEDVGAVDPRAAILRYAEVAAKEPVFFGKAYESTQPKPVFAAPPDETQKQEDDEELQLAKRVLERVSNTRKQ